MELNYRKIIKEFYCKAYKWRISFFSLCLLLSSIIVLHWVFSWPKIVDKFIWIFWVSWILLAIILMIFPAWLSLRFRYLAWWTSQCLGVIIKCLRSGWTIFVLLVLGVASTLFIRGTIINSQKNITINSFQHSFIINNATWTGPISVNWIDVLSPDFWMKVFAVSALILLAYQAYNSRKRIVLLPFSNQTGDEELKSSIEGISSLLQNELARLTRLCNEVDDTNPYNPETLAFDGKSSSANLSVSVGESLENIVTSDTKVKLGPLEIPVGATIGLLAKVIKGPQLNGGLHKEDGRLVLIANLKGGGFNNDWRITGSDSPDQEASSVDHIAHMTQQLAYRIFADLNKESLGSTSGKAVCHYTKGLRAYRETLLTDRDKSPKLRKAEKAFLLALGEDKKFFKCYYNLGVVYNALGQKESAFSVLKKSVDPDQPEAYLSEVYYALARNHRSIQDKRAENADFIADYKISIELCEKAIELQPKEARNWDLLGFLKRKEKENELRRKLKAREEPSFWNEEVIPIREIATALAWREMCCCALKSKKVKSMKKIAITCTRNLAVAYSQANPASGKLFFNQAIHLAPSDVELYYELGKTLNEIGDWGGAAKVLEDAVKIEPRPAYWSELSVAYANLYEKDGKEDHEKLASDAYRHVMHCPSESEEMELKPEMALFKLMPSLLSLFSNTSSEEYYNNMDLLKKRLSNWNWDFAKALLRLAGLLPVIDNDYAEAKELNDSAIRLKKALDALTILLKENKNNYSKLDDPAKNKLKRAIKDLKDLNPRMEEISSLSQANNDLDYAWYYLSFAEQLIDSDNVFPDINGFFKVALRDFRENLFPHALVINTLNQLDSGETECPEQYKERLEKLAKRLSIWDWGYDKVLFKLNNPTGIYYEKAGKSPRLELVSELLDNLENNKDNMTRLEELDQRQIDGCWDWGHGQVLLALSDIESDGEKKEKMLKTAQSSLENEFLFEIANKGVHGHLADVLASQKKFGEALYCAQRSVSLSPERSWDRSKLSYVYQSFKDFEESSSQLEICMSIDSKDFSNYESMARSKFMSIIQLSDMDARQKGLKRYVEILLRFLELIQNDLITNMNEAEKNVKMRSWAHFWLGYAYYELNKYDLAISNWIESKYLSKKFTKKSHLIACLFLGIVYLDIKAYDECEKIFNNIINFIEEKELNGVTRNLKDSGWAYAEVAGKELVGEEFGFNDISLGYLMAHACLSLSFSYAQRHANLADAVSHVEKAEGYLSNVLDPDRKNELDAMHDDRKGWIIYTQVKLGEGSNNIKDAIDWLKKAVNKSASPENYLHLAMALEYKLEVEGETLQKTESGKSELQRLLDYALACCDHVIDLDLQKKYAEQAKELRKRLEKLRKSGRQ